MSEQWTEAVIWGLVNLAALAVSLKQRLCQVEPDDLRKDENARRRAYDAAVQMRGDLVAFFGGQMQ